MPVRKDPDGRRSVQVQAEVPGTPEEVWEAIATGPGITSWFVPTEIEGREGGKVVAHFGPGDSMDSVATVTVWEPPHRFVAESRNMGPESPSVADEWTVEAQAGGTCIVRVVHSWFMSTDDWDNQFEQAEAGWAVFFRILRLVLAHFKGQPCTAFQLAAMAPEPTADAWRALAGGLGLADLAVGQRFSAADDAPTLAGTVAEVGPSEFPGLMLLLDAPSPGLCHLFAMPMGQIYLSIRLFFFGEGAPAAAAQSEPVWQAWLASHFPPPAPGAAPTE